MHEFPKLIINFLNYSYICLFQTCFVQSNLFHRLWRDFAIFSPNFVSKSKWNFHWIESSFITFYWWTRKGCELWKRMWMKGLACWNSIDFDDDEFSNKFLNKLFLFPNHKFFLIFLEINRILTNQPHIRPTTSKVFPFYFVLFVFVPKITVIKRLFTKHAMKILQLTKEKCIFIDLSERGSINRRY